MRVPKYVTVGSARVMQACTSASVLKNGGENPHPTKNDHFRNYRINEKQRVINELPPGGTDLNASRRFAKNLLPTILER